MNKTWIVALETYLRQVKSWSFVMLVVSPFLLLAVSLGVGYFSGSSNTNSQRIAVISDQPQLRAAFIKDNQADVSRDVTTVAAAKKRVANDKLAGYLKLSADSRRVTGRYYSQDSISSSMETSVKGFLNKTQQTLNLQNAKLKTTQLKALSQQPVFKQHIHKTSGSSDIAKIASFWILVFVIYMVLLTYSSITAQEIASEKGTKIMEIIFSSTKASKYFIGKITGVMMVILTQILIYLVGGAAFYLGLNQIDTFRKLFDQYRYLIQPVIGNLLNVNLLYLFLGVIIYTIVSAFSGALVAKAEDAPKAAQPAIYLGMTAFFLTFPFQSNPTGLIVKVLSYVPFFSSYFMPLRVIYHQASPLEISLSLLVLILTIGLLAWYISRIYEGLILQTDDSSFWKRLKRGLTYQN